MKVTMRHSIFPLRLFSHKYSAYYEKLEVRYQRKKSIMTLTQSQEIHLLSTPYNEFLMSVSSKIHILTHVLFIIIIIILI